MGYQLSLNMIDVYAISCKNEMLSHGCHQLKYVYAGYNTNYVHPAYFSGINL